MIHWSFPLAGHRTGQGHVTWPVTMNHKQIPNCAQNELNHSINTGEAAGTTGTG
jgi:hypothetical protein